MKISVIGTGYVGLVTGACLADMGNDVLCLDLDQRKINQLKEGKIPFYEPGLEQLVQRNVAENRLHFTTDPVYSAQFGLAQFIAVGTPPGEDGSADLQYVLEAAKEIARCMDGYRLVINKSTVPVGTADKVRRVINDVLFLRESDLSFHVVSNPEFLKEGSAIDDFMRPDRIIVGCDDMEVIPLIEEIYAPFQRARDKIIMMDVRSAEMTKYAANTMLASRISFMNELSWLAEQLGIDIDQVRKGIGADPRIGHSFLYAVCGYGGSCLPKDVSALRRMFIETGIESPMLDGIHQVKEQQKNRLANKVIQRFGGDLTGKTFAVWGLAFKPNTDDVREAPSLSLISALLDHNARVIAFDPIAQETFAEAFGDHCHLSYAESNYDALDQVDALIIMTEWHIFRNPDFVQMQDTMKTPIIFDGRNLYHPSNVSEKGFEYHCIGRVSKALS